MHFTKLKNGRVYKNMKILLAEDERSMARGIARILEKNNYHIDAVYNGIVAVNYLLDGDYDAVILDIMMPGMNGFEVLKKIREKGISIPVMFLTAKAGIDDKVQGLDGGANDYLTKPFNARELLARMRVLTRGQNSIDSRLSFGNIILDRVAFKLYSQSGSFTLTNKEFQIMEILLSNPSCVVSAERFLEKIWGYDAESDVNVVWVYISYLRKKLGLLQANIQIKTTRNAGYSLEKI